MNEKISSSFSNYESKIKSSVSNLKGNIEKIKVPYKENYVVNDFSTKVDEMDLSLELELLPIDAVAKQVINGEWGNGDERKRKLEEAGYNVAEVQGMVNEILIGVNTYVPSEPIMETKDEPVVEEVVEPLTEVSSASNSMGSKRILNTKKPEIIIDEFSMKEIDNSTDVSSKSFVSNISEGISNLTNKVSDKVQQVANDERIRNVSVEELNSIKNKYTYDKLSDTSNDKYKFMWLFGENKTVGLNGEVISFDKMDKVDGSILYFKDGKCIKSVTNDYVSIVDEDNVFVYHKDGSWESHIIQDEYIKISTYYDSNDVKLEEKIIDKTEGITSIITKQYHQNGNVLKEENNCAGYSSYKEYDIENNLIAEKKWDGSYIEYNGNKITKITEKNGTTTEYMEDGSVIIKNSNGNPLKIEYSDGSSISYKFDGTLNKVVKVDGTIINYYNEYKYQEIKPDGSSTTYEFYENGNPKRVSTPNGSYDSFYKEYDELGNLVSEKNEYAKITYVDGKPDSFEISASSYNGGARGYTAHTDSGDYLIKVNQDATKVLQVIDPNGNIINDFGSGITLIKWWD